MQLKQVAREQAAGNGESDLRRMKRQFASLKNTFILYDVKQSFIEGTLVVGEDAKLAPASLNMSMQISKHNFIFCEADPRLQIALELCLPLKAKA